MTFLSTIISSISLLYRLWKDKVFFKLVNYFKDRKPDFKGDYWAIAERQQRQLFSLAYKIQHHFVLRRGTTFISWRDWFALTYGLQYTVEHAQSLDSNHIGYLSQKLPAPSYGTGINGLLDGIGYLMTQFPYEGKKVSNSDIEHIMRDFMFCLRPEVTRYHKNEIDEIKRALRSLQMIMLSSK